MRLPISDIVASLLALSQLAIVNAYPIYNAIEEQEDAHKRTDAVLRATKETVVLLQRARNT